ncbi:MAG: bifunctional 4-hydroxy-2-oxoglutarate aldolase/2-dehydro-3-deoxy-phosphogluconate aldolase [Balneolaceae bacterium]
MNKQETIAFIEHHKAVAVMRFSDSDLFDPLAEAIFNGGIQIIEITMTVPDALSIIEKVTAGNLGDRLVGVGSVLDAKSARQAIKAGAQFIVSPVLKKEIIMEAQSADVPVMPGAFTPTEVQTAWEWGADIVKIFPANILGMDFFKGVKAPMPHLKLMPTGGVSLTNARDWINSGACAVGIGSALFDKEAIKKRDFDQIRENAEALVSNLSEE